MGKIAVLSIIGLVASYYALAIAVSGITRSKMPETALQFLPSDSVALAARADRLFFAKPDNPPSDVRNLAVAALRNQAINPKALRLLGFFADAQGEDALAERYIRMASRLSRRDAPAQLWLIEASARRNDTRQTLAHYDVVLRTKPDNQAVLFPRLLSALDNREVRRELTPYIRSGTGWTDTFLFYADANSKDLPALVNLVVESKGLPKRKRAAMQYRELLNRLVTEQYFADARRLFLQMPGAIPSRLTEVRFDASDRDGRFGAMGWEIIDDPEAGGGFSGSTKDNIVSLAVFANPATTRPVARKLLYLKPGSYRFATRVASMERGEGGYLRWQLRCPIDEQGSPVWTLESSSRAASGNFTVSGNCPVQFLELILSGGQGQTGVEITIASVSVIPIGN